jgi:hypothetical protein
MPRELLSLQYTVAWFVRKYFIRIRGGARILILGSIIYCDVFVDVTNKREKGF